VKLKVETKKEPKPKPSKPEVQTPASVKPAEVNASQQAEEGVEKGAPVGEKPSKREIAPWIAWGAAGIMILILAVVVLQLFGVIPTAASSPQPVSTQTALDVPIPAFQPTALSDSLKPIANPKTTRPDRGNEFASTYVVQKGDSIFGIANQYKLKPESVLWSNYNELKDDPQNVSVGVSLNIPPVDGIYYLWQQGDTLESVAGKYQVTPEDILMWPGNNIDIANPVILPNQFVMIPGGQSEFKQWVVPIAYSPHSGATRSINNQCAIPDDYYGGTGAFIWPSANHSVSGNDFWGGHLGIDIAASLGDNVWASDAGVVVFAGGRSDGYGNTVIIEHDVGNITYHSLYAHLSAVTVHCGQRVSQGQPIGAAGSTGNSTGPHIHFEIRENGAFINPHQVLQ
jgi:murein DD-endopeptidase MepM/ murein hydrolase activator NlpD